MDKELEKVMKTGLLLVNASPSVSADVFRRMSKFEKRMMRDRMMAAADSDRKFRAAEMEAERKRVKVMAPGVASAISALREVQRETKYRNIARQEEAAARAAARAAAVPRSRSGSPVRAAPAAAKPEKFRTVLSKGKYIIGVSSGPKTSPFASVSHISDLAGNPAAAEYVLSEVMEEIAPGVDSGVSARSVPFMGERGHERIIAALMGKGLDLGKGQKAVATMEIKDLHSADDGRLVEFGVEREGPWMRGYTDVSREFLGVLRKQFA